MPFLSRSYSVVKREIYTAVDFFFAKYLKPTAMSAAITI